jgi:hypothetical protein
MATNAVVSSFDNEARQLREEWLHRARQGIFIKGKRDVAGKMKGAACSIGSLLSLIFVWNSAINGSSRDRPTMMQIPSPCDDIPYQRNSSAGLGDDPQRREIKGKLQGSSSISCGCPFPNTSS